LVADETVVANEGKQARPARVGPRPQLKILGILGLLIAIAVITASINGTFLLENNVENLVRRTALYGILGIGVAFVIITGGIDLSIGSVVALVGCLLPFLIKMEFRTPDQREILEVNQGTPTVLVAGAFDSLKPGDFLHVSGDGPNKIVLPVKAVRFDPQFDFYGRRQPTTQVELTQPVHVPIAVGKATKAYKISSVDAATRNLEVATTDRPPVARDRITLASAEGTGLYQVEVVRADAEPDHVHLEVSDPSQRLGRVPFQYAMIQRHAQPMTVPVAVSFLLLLSAGIGLFHGLLITKLKLQPFVVTLCGLLLYRGIARGITADQTQGFGTLFTDLRYLATGNPFAIPVPFLNWLSVRSTRGPLWTWIDVPMPFVIMTILAIVAAIFLNRTIYGRYLLALGRNEQAARYSGINTDRMIVLAYVICSLLAGLGGMLFIFDTNTGQPVDFGNFYELYAIAAAVLGGCSLRGGEGTILGVVIGAAVMQVLYNSINLLKIPTQLEFAIIGAVILAGVIVDELAKRFAARRRAERERAGLAVTAAKSG
jgi:ribose transport system permease protein